MSRNGISDDENNDGAELVTLVNSKGTISTAHTDVNAEGNFSNPVEDPNSNSNIQPEPSPLIKACQAGDLKTVKELIESNEASPHDLSPDGTSPLHWAAINNRLTICQYLLEKGAQIDFKGGQLEATPLHWACRNGLVYIVHLLINKGADPLRTDLQGFNALHLATHSSNVMLVIYLLHYGLQADVVDPNGRSSLHWAAYQGDALTIDTLLKWGADVKLKDSMGFIPLHWAIVKGSKPCIQRLIEEGSDVFALANDGKSPGVMAKEMNTVQAFEDALVETGRYKNGQYRTKYLSEKATNIIIFSTPSLILPIIWGTLASFIWIISIPLSGAIYYGYLKLLNNFIFPNAYVGHGALLLSPLLSGIFFASCLWTWIVYLLFILPSTILLSPLLNILFIIFFSLVIYTFFKIMFMDPGYVPKLSGINEQNEVIEELINSGDFDSRHFCIITYVRKPLRSKFDRKSKRVVARFDHYCPWVNNVIGIRNHRLFVIYVLSLLIGISLFVGIFFNYYSASLITDSPPKCEILPIALCNSLEYSTFTTTIVLWDCLQLVWIIFLSFVQLVQIGRSMTTNEATNLHRFGFMGADDFSSSPLDHPSNVNNLNNLASLPTKPQTKCWSTTFRVLGIDQFVSTSKDTFSRNRLANNTNPADYGFLRNCEDFWFPGGNLNVLQVPKAGEGSLGGHIVDYYQLWDFPKAKGAQGYEQV